MGSTERGCAATARVDPRKHLRIPHERFTSTDMEAFAESARKAYRDSRGRPQSDGRHNPEVRVRGQFDTR